MNSTEYAEIGRWFKLAHPGTLDHHEDDEVGVVAVKKGYWPPKDINTSDTSLILAAPFEIDARTHHRDLPLNTDPFWFVGSRVKNLDKQIEYIGKQAAKQTGIESAQFEYDHHPQALEREHRLQLMQYVVAMLTTRQQAELAQLATAYKLDTATYLAWRLTERTLDITLRQLEETKRIETDNTARLNQIELVRLEKQKQIEYEHEQKLFHAKVGSAVDYANTAHLVWMRKNGDLKDLYRQVDEAQGNRTLSDIARKRTIVRLEKQIEQLEAELDGTSGETV